MRTKRYQNYLEEEVLAANPLQLVRLLYRGALDSITAARRHLRLGEIRSRSGAISKTMAIVTELSRSLDRQQSGELSHHLEELYSYVQSLLIEANVSQSDPPLAEAETLLSTLLEAWEHCAKKDDGGASHVHEAAIERESVSCAY
jgi:flagellar protein FliS